MIYNIVTLSIFIVCSVYVSLKDIQTFHLPLFTIYLALFLELLITLIINREILINSLIGMITFFILLFSINFAVKNGIGYGDIQYALLCGFICKFPGCFFSGAFAAIIGILFFLLLKLIFHKNIRKLKIPFVPFMFTGTLITFFLNPYINRLYN